MLVATKLAIKLPCVEQKVNRGFNRATDGTAVYLM